MLAGILEHRGFSPDGARYIARHWVVYGGTAAREKMFLIISECARDAEEIVHNRQMITLALANYHEQHQADPASVDAPFTAP